MVRGRSDTGELSLLASRELGRERRANAVGRAGRLRVHRVVQPTPSSRGVSLRTALQRRRCNGIEMPQQDPL